jgi:hypothetical protein
MCTYINMNEYAYVFISPYQVKFETPKHATTSRQDGDKASKDIMYRYEHLCLYRYVYICIYIYLYIYIHIYISLYQFKFDKPKQATILRQDGNKTCIYISIFVDYVYTYVLRYIRYE